MDWFGCDSIEYALNYYEEWNKKNHKDMYCIHTYAVRQITVRGKGN